jgi:ribonuclease E
MTAPGQQNNPDANREPRQERGPRGDRAERGERPERGPRGNADRGARNSTDGAPTDGRPEARNDRGDRNDRGERNDRGDRRPDRAPRGAENTDNQQAAAEVNSLASTGASAQDGNPTAQHPADGSGDNAPTREKRSRDRYGRDRGPRGERGDRGERNDRGDQGEQRPDQPRDGQAALDGFAPVNSESNEAETRVQQAQTAPVFVANQGANPASAAQTAAPVATAAAVVAPLIAAVSVAAPVAQAASPAVTALPKVQNFNLPVESLVQVAQGSGLSWVNSDPAKIAAVQAAIAAEAKPIHVPRARPTAVQFDAEPLVLVETKRDLKSMKLPFEDTAPS